MKLKIHCVLPIILLLITGFCNFYKVEGIKEDLSNGIFLPQAIGVYQKWNYTTADDVLSSPIFADLDKDGFQEVLVGSNDNTFYCFNHLGTQLWNFTSTADFRSSPFFPSVPL